MTAVYFRTLSGGPLIDDFTLLAVANNGGPFANFAPVNGHGLFWRPVVSAILKIEWIAFHHFMPGYRLFSVLLCALTAVAIGNVLFRLTDRRRAAILSAVLFVLWPSHPESIVWIAGQTDGIATCLAWLGAWAFVVFWLSERASLQTAGLSLFLLAAALLAKESAVVTPAIVFLTGFIVRPGFTARRVLARAALSATMLALTFGYLLVRSHALHVSLFGGGYASTTAHGVLQAVSAGYSNYHLSFNLLNSFAPLSNRLATPLGWQPDAFVAFLLLLGVGAVAGRFPRSAQQPGDWLGPYLLVGYLAGILYFTFGVYPLLFIVAVMRLPAGWAALFVICLVTVIAACRYRRSMKEAWEWLEGPKPALFGSLLLALPLPVLFQWARQGAPPVPLFILTLLFSSARFAARPLRISDSREPIVVLMLVAFAVIALAPVITIRQVDANLAIARLSYLVTTFSVPAICVSILLLAGERRLAWVVPTLVGFGLALAGTLSVERGWALSGHISRVFLAEVSELPGRRIYLLASPGDIPSSNSVVLGGDFVADAPALFGNGATVVPVLFADGFSFGDRLSAVATGPNSWQVRVDAASLPYRSGLAKIVTCDSVRNVGPEVRVSTVSDRAADVTIQRLGPDDVVLLANQDGIARLN